MSDDDMDYRRGKGVIVRPGKRVQGFSTQYADVLLEEFEKHGPESEVIKAAVATFGLAGVDARIADARLRKAAAK